MAAPEPEVVQAEAVPFDPAAPRRVGASTREIQCAIMIAQGLTTEEMAKRLGLKPRTVEAKWRGRPVVKALVEEYRRSPGNIAFDLLESWLPNAVQVLLDLSQDKDKRLALDAAKFLTKLVADLRKQPNSQIQIGIFAGVTRQARALEMTDEEMEAEADRAALALGYTKREEKSDELS